MSEIDSKIILVKIFFCITTNEDLKYLGSSKTGRGRKKETGRRRESKKRKRRGRKKSEGRSRKVIRTFYCILFFIVF